MRILTLLAAVMLMLSLPSLAFQQEPTESTAKEEMKKFQGDWQAVEFWIGSVGASPEQIEQTSMVIKGNEFTIKIKDNVVKGTFTINPLQNPKTIDVVIIGDDGTRTSVEGIYQWVNGKRRSCIAFPNITRPNEFRQQQGYVTMEWKKK